ncbi:hypothetical protein E1287_32035 [Actinomadura sp. KC06]|uniref:hypothetical protein n=1 Tax=Actinomadura sp. KC06 TaxID=2530369 RepID=UPI0010483E25|nr:hypothetical protein [Actinomadura sp. KC06]TDD28844.1 hypothetical protein E1287_32035 [Actinomadura sp. KC06]
MRLRVLGVIIAVGASAAAMMVALARDDGVTGPHRIAGGYPAPPADGSPRWEVPAHRWVGLEEAWEAPQVDDVPHAYGLASDEQRVFALHLNIDDPGGPTRRSGRS